MKTHIAIYFGAGKDKAGNRLDDKQVEGAIETIEYLACKLAGGCTLSKTHGSWLNEGRIVREAGFKLDLVCDSDTALQVAHKLSKACREELNQDCVLVESYRVDSQFI